MAANLLVAGGTVVDDGRGIERDVAIGNGVIERLDQPGRRSKVAILDATDCFVLPGYIDVQLNGGFGVDFTTEPDRMAHVAARLPPSGVTSFLPTVITCAPDDTARAITALGTSHPVPGQSRSLGVHLEGPFLAPARRGAHPAQHLRAPDVREAKRWTAGAGVAMVTLAPELPGSLDVVGELVDAGVVVCAGHTNATAEDIDRATSSGITGATHLYNAMGSVSARAAGTIGPLLAHRSIICGLIVDGIHVDPTMIDVAMRALGTKQIALVTDAMAALGLPFGEYRIGDTTVVVDATGARTNGGVLAGSVLTMDQAVRNLIAFTGCSIAEASLCASTTPARLLGRADLGRVTPGRTADLVLVDQYANVVATVIDGHVAHDPHHRSKD